MSYQIFAQAHPSGVGVYLSPPPLVWYRIWRDNGPTLESIDEDGQLVKTDIPVLGGRIAKPMDYLDWDIRGEAIADKPVRYTLEIGESEDGPWREHATQEVALVPYGSYSMLEDERLFDTLVPRDALIVFLSIRLAQLVRGGHLYIRPDKRSERRNKFPVFPHWDFGEMDVPLIALDTTSGSSETGDLGGFMQSERDELLLYGVCRGREERDSLRMAIRGLRSEMEWLLSELGAASIEMSQLLSTFDPQPPGAYLLEARIGVEFYTYPDYEGPLWTLIPPTRWDSVQDPVARAY